MYIKNAGNNLEPFTEPSNPYRIKKVGGIVGTFKPLLKTKGLPGPGKIHRGLAGI